MPHVGSVTGIDVSSGLLEVAARQNPDARYQHYYGGAIPYKEDRSTSPLRRASSTTSNRTTGGSRLELARIAPAVWLVSRNRLIH